MKNQDNQPKPNEVPAQPGQNPDTGKTTNPGKPNNDPDQTPERETDQPPVAKPDKNDKPGKIGFQDNFLLY